MEKRTAVIYDMAVAKGGLKMKVSSPPEDPTPASGVFPATAPAGRGLMESYSEGKVELRGQRVTMRQLIVRITEKTDRPIVDKTGLTETYDFDMRWTPGGETAASDANGVVEDVGDTIYSALERYFGATACAA
jgi:uncharacterized protein (TIGR03435 family)